MKRKTIMGLEYKWEMLLVYLIGILGLIFSFMKDKKIDKDVKFQYNQAGTIFIISVIISVIVRIFRYSLSFMVFTSYALAIVQLILFIFSIMAIVKAFSNESYKIPVIYDLSQKLFK